MIEKKYTIEGCPIRNILSRLGNKWSMLVLYSLHEQKLLRFRDLCQIIPDISQRMLSVTLRSLEEDGLILRKIYPEVPPRVEYRLSSTGESLMPHISALIQWASLQMDGIMENRQASH